MWFGVACGPPFIPPHSAPQIEDGAFATSLFYKFNYEQLPPRAVLNSQLGVTVERTWAFLHTPL